MVTVPITTLPTGFEQPDDATVRAITMHDVMNRLRFIGRLSRMMREAIGSRRISLGNAERLSVVAAAARPQRRHVD